VFAFTIQKGTLLSD